MHNRHPLIILIIMARTASSLGRSLLLTSVLALLSYIPFEYIAKITLAFCAIVFIGDPIPPISRLLALTGVLLVALLSKIERQWRSGQIHIDIDTSIKERQNDNLKNDKLKPTKAA